MPKTLRRNFNLISLVFLFIFFSDFKGPLYEKDISNTFSASNINDTVPKLNIILILADDIGYEVPTYTGGQSYSTPNIDSLAHNGMQFTQCQGSALCSPSRFMLMTGKYNFRNYHAWGIMDTSQRTIANMLKNAGYNTCVAGKWQLDGGDTSIRKFGFDKYCVFNPFYSSSEDVDSATSGFYLDAYRYKDPLLFENNAYLPNSFTNGKYSEDIFGDYMSDFIDSNLHHPFFIYYPLSLCHIPFFPTPDDSEYAAFNPKKAPSNTKFFPSMVNYMDKKIGQLVQKIRSAGLENNTLIIYFGDNGTPGEIQSMFNGTSITGGKGKTIVYGTHVPLIFYLPGRIAPHSVSNNLIDFTDFLPTIADIAGINLPHYGPLDGLSFYSSIFGLTGPVREWSFCHFDPMHGPGKGNQPDTFVRYVQTVNYKLYDSTGSVRDTTFFNLFLDPAQKKPKSANTLTTYEIKTKNEFKQVLSQMHN